MNSKSKISIWIAIAIGVISLGVVATFLITNQAGTAVVNIGTPTNKLCSLSANPNYIRINMPNPEPVNFSATIYPSRAVISRASWDFGDGSTFIGKNTLATHTYEHASSGGFYDTTVTFNTSLGNISCSTRVYIDEHNNDISCVLTAEPYHGPAPLDVHFEGITSDGSNPEYIWDFDDGFTDVGPSPKDHTFVSNKQYVVSTSFITPSGLEVICDRGILVADLP